MFKATIILSAILLSACASNENQSYVAEYRTAISQAQQHNIPVAAVENFVALFSNLNAPDLAEKVNTIYAEKIYFNDTLNTIRERGDMLNYLKHTATNLSNYEFKLSDHIVSGDNLYLRWTMDIEFTAMGKDIKSQSIGMTQLKFNSDGKVVMHQDFWDSVEAIYQHLPYIGYWVKKARSKL